MSISEPAFAIVVVVAVVAIVVVVVEKSTFFQVSLTVITVGSSIVSADGLERSGIPEISLFPLFSSSIKHSTSLSPSMTCRC